MRKLKPLSLVSLLLVAALVPALGAGPVAAQQAPPETSTGDGDDELLTGVDMTDSVALGVAAFALALVLVGRERL